MAPMHKARPPGSVATSAQAASLSRLANLGPKSAELLLRAGITSRAQLVRLGAVKAYAMVRCVAPRVSLNLLWALEGAIGGLHWQAVAKVHRTSLLLASAAHRCGRRCHRPQGAVPRFGHAVSLIQVRQRDSIARPSRRPCVQRLSKLPWSRYGSWSGVAAAVQWAACRSQGGLHPCQRSTSSKGPSVPESRRSRRHMPPASAVFTSRSTIGLRGSSVPTVRAQA